MKTKFLFYTLSLVLCTACNLGDKGSALPDDDRYGGVMVLNQFEGFSTTFPPTTYEMSSAELGSHIYETLVGYDGESMEPSPVLAESWTINDDATEFRFKIRNDVYFHDDACFGESEGRQMSPEDVLHCMRFLCSQHPLNKSQWLFSDLVIGAATYAEEGKDPYLDEVEGLFLDGDELVFRLKQANVEFIHVLAHYNSGIYPKEAMDHYGNAVNMNPVGTGPFLRRVLRKGEVSILERHSRYWDTDSEGNPLPYLDGLKVGFAKDASTVRSAMEKESLHLIMDADMVEGGEVITELTQREFSNYRSSSISELETVFLGFLNDEGVFADARIRRAFGLALDKERIAQDILRGSGAAGNYGLVPPAFKNYPYEEVTGFSQDVETARGLLVEAGFGEGTDFPIVTLQIQNRFSDVIVAQEVQRQILDNLGISLSLSALPREQHFARIENREAQLWLDNWVGDFLDPQNFLNLMLSANTPEEGQSFLNIYRYKNPSFDKLVFDAIKVSDEKKRMELYCKADDLLMKEAAIIPIYYEEKQVIQHAKVQGLNGPVLGVLDLKTAYLEK